jgi:hypothetical protein
MVEAAVSYIGSDAGPRLANDLERGFEEGSPCSTVYIYRITLYLRFAVSGAARLFGAAAVGAGPVLSMQQQLWAF